MISSLESFLWQRGLADRPWPARMAILVARYVYALVRELLAGQLTLRAMSLVYTTLLSVVPLLAFSFSVLKGFGVHNRLQDELYLLTAPLGERGVELTDRIIDMVDKVNGNVLGTLSLAFFIYTAIAMVQKVEASFNYVWLVSQPRSIARRVTEYVSVLLIGPLLISIALGLVASLSSDGLVQRLTEIEPFGTLLGVIGRTVPYLIVVGVFTFLYSYIPNARVNLRSALTGAVCAGILWVSAGALFARFASNLAARDAIYGIFAVSISALIWLYLSWLILLIGAQIAFYRQNPLHIRLGRSEPRMSGALRERIALNAMLLVGAAFRDTAMRCTTGTISREIRVPELTLAPVLNDLETAGLILTNENDELLPAREMSRIRLTDILAAVRQGGETGLLVPPTWSNAVVSIATEIDTALEEVAADTTLADFVDREAAASVTGDGHALNEQ